MGVGLGGGAWGWGNSGMIASDFKREGSKGRGSVGAEHVAKGTAKEGRGGSGGEKGMTPSKRAASVAFEGECWCGSTSLGPATLECVRYRCG